MDGFHHINDIHAIAVLSDDPISFTITVTSDAGENGESKYIVDVSKVNRFVLCKIILSCPYTCFN